MASICRIAGRSGFYLRVAVPSDLHKVMKTRAVVRKAGATKAEALRNRTALLVAVEELFRQKRGLDPIGATFNAVQPGNDLFLQTLTDNLRQLGKSDAEIDSILYGREEVEAQGLGYTGDDKAERALQAHLDGSQGWEVWLADRVKAEAPAPTTKTAWVGAIRRFAEWFGSDYVSTATKDDAAAYKMVLLDKMMSSSVKAELTRLKAWWNYAKEHNQVTENIWDGLTRKLKASKKKARVDKQTLDAARLKADELDDFGFWIQLLTGCRRGEHCGLRYCDVDLVDNTIRFEEWIGNGMDRRLKGGEKDERTVPMHSLLRQKLIAMVPDIETNNTTDLLLNDWSPSKRIFGRNWGDAFGLRYGFNSHELRANCVSQLQAMNVSPYFLHEITRHSVPGMSDVVAGYVRPTMDELREVIERLK